MDNNPRFQPWVCEIRNPKPRQGRQIKFAGLFSFAPDGAYVIYAIFPRLKPWVTFIRAYGAFLAHSNLLFESRRKPTTYLALK
jgi:hypothetical protein